MRTGRIVQLAVGVVVVLVGLPLFVGGLAPTGLYVVVRDSDGWFRTSTERVTTEGRAIVSDVVAAVPFGGELGTVHLPVDGEGLFVGVAPSADVDRYLDGVAHDVVGAGLFGPNDDERATVAGTGTPAPPATQGFWAASGTGELTWDGTDRDPPFSLDADPTYPADLAVAYRERLSRGLVLVKWWLLAIPHHLVVAVLAGGLGVHLGGAVAAGPTGSSPTPPCSPTSTRRSASTPVAPTRRRPRS